MDTTTKAYIGARSVEDFCAKTGLGRTFVYAEIKKGRLRAVKAGRRTLILDADGDAYLRALPSTIEHAA